MSTPESAGAHFLENSRKELAELKALAEKALAQVPDESMWHRRIDGESNSIAIIIRHLAGNMLSRWTDFLTTDGEKTSRDRDGEFDPSLHVGKAELLARWEKGWSALFAALAPLGAGDLLRRVMIREKPLTVLEAIQRQLSHYAYHVGQIVFLARHLGPGDWRSLSVPRAVPRRKLRVLFLCTGNSCRSQMAEGWARRLQGDIIEAHSAGIEPHGLDPLAVKVMAEAGVDISRHRSKHVDELKGVKLDHVIAVCSSAAESCPVFPGAVPVMRAAFDDPPRLAREARSEEEALGHYRRVRDEIRAFVERVPEALAGERQASRTKEKGS